MDGTHGGTHQLEAASENSGKHRSTGHWLIRSPGDGNDGNERQGGLHLIAQHLNHHLLNAILGSAIEQEKQMRCQYGRKRMNDHSVCQRSYCGDISYVTTSSCSQGFKAQRGAGICPCPHSSLASLLTPHLPTTVSVTKAHSLVQLCAPATSTWQ